MIKNYLKSSHVLDHSFAVPVLVCFSQQDSYPVSMLCRVLKIHRSGFYQWLKSPQSSRAKDNERLVGLIKQSWLESGCVYGSPRIHADLREMGETCGKHRVARLMRVHGIAAVLGYKRRYRKTNKPSVVAPNRLKQVFSASSPDKCWVTDITYIRTYEGWLYLSVAVDLYSRQVIGWSMSSRIKTDIVLSTLLMALWRRHPEQEVIVHSDQGIQYTSDECQRFMRQHGLISSMSRRGNCYDNAVAESFFHSLKTERIKRKIYTTREQARRDIFDYIEVFYNQKRRHSFNNHQSPVEFERQQTTRTELSME